MKALILAAGTGQRLKPITEHTPKALIEIGGVPMLEIIIKRLAGAGFNSLVINIHHFSQQIRDFIASNKSFGLNISFSDESDLLLDTGGAIKKAAAFFKDDDCFLVHNVDILTNLDYKELFLAHQATMPLATLVVKDRPTTRNLLVDQQGRLSGWEYPDKHVRILTKETVKGLNYTAFSGIYVLSPRILNLMPEEQVFGFMPWILDLSAEHSIMTWDQAASFWYEAGRPESIRQAECEIVFQKEDSTFILRK